MKRLIVRFFAHGEYENKAVLVPKSKERVLSPVYGWLEGGETIPYEPSIRLWHDGDGPRHPAVGDQDICLHLNAQPYPYPLEWQWRPMCEVVQLPAA